MSKKRRPSGVHAEIAVYGHYRCKGPGCKKTIIRLNEAIFTIRSGEARGFCCTDCFFRASQQYIDEVRANQVATKRNNLLKGMGFYERTPDDRESVG